VRTVYDGGRAIWQGIWRRADAVLVQARCRPGAGRATPTGRQASAHPQACRAGARWRLHTMGSRLPQFRFCGVRPGDAIDGWSKIRITMHAERITVSAEGRSCQSTRPCRCCRLPAVQTLGGRAAG
jgi:hypothetical protein